MDPPRQNIWQHAAARLVAQQRVVVQTVLRNMSRPVDLQPAAAADTPEIAAAVARANEVSARSLRGITAPAAAAPLSPRTQASASSGAAVSAAAAAPVAAAASDAQSLHSHSDDESCSAVAMSPLQSRKRKARHRSVARAMRGAHVLCGVTSCLLLTVGGCVLVCLCVCAAVCMCVYVSVRVLCVCVL